MHTAASPGQKFSGGATVDVTGSPGATSAALAFFDSSGNVAGLVLGQATTPAASSWTSLAAVAGIAPAGTVGVAIGVVEFTSSVGQEIYVESPTLGSIGAGAPSVVGPLHTSGNQIVQSNGQPLVLRGLVLDGLEYTGALAGSGVTYDSVLEARRWGANFVRLPLGEQFWLSSNCDYSSAYTSAVDQAVNWITSLGMVALLDLHTNTVQGCETGKQHNMADEAQSPAFLGQLAARYGNPTSPEYSPLVAFDLYNEPHDISDTVWLNGGQVADYYSPNETYQAAGMQQLYDAVRGGGAQSLVFVSGNDWAGQPPTSLVNGSNIVYAVHEYTCPTTAPPSCADPSPYDPSPVLNTWVPFSASQPVVVTEFGWPSSYDGTYLANVIAFAGAHGWGWSAFAWQQENWGGFVLANWLGDGAAEPNPSGDPVLLALSGAA
jgi:hypothetical protein